MAMCFLVQQLRTEKKVDICSVVRKLRSQRMGMIEKYVSDSSLSSFWDLSIGAVY